MELYFFGFLCEFGVHIEGTESLHSALTTDCLSFPWGNQPLGLILPR